jgi:tetratricopeptide (TPR) repeat protein
VKIFALEMWRVLGLGAILAAGGMVGAGCRRHAAEKRPLPNLVLEFLGQNPPRTVYFNGAAHGALVLAKPEWLAASDYDPRGERVRSMAQAAQNPKLFRQLDRQEHFDAILLAGDPLQYRPLLEHLIKMGDWSLEWADAFGLVYRRGREETVSMERIRGVPRQWESLEAETRASYLSAFASHLTAAHRTEAAREMLDLAFVASPNSPAAWASEGAYRLARGEWAPALAAADRALRGDKNFRPGLSIKAQALYFSKRFGEAYALSCRLLQDAPDDPVMLFAHAKIAHEVRALQEEISVLRKLIGIAEKEGRSTAWYRVFLGQALGITGDGEGALRELGAAMQDPELPPEQREFAKDAFERVKTNLGKLAPSK